MGILLSKVLGRLVIRIRHILYLFLRQEKLIHNMHEWIDMGPISIRYDHSHITRSTFTFLFRTRGWIDQ